MRPSAIVAHAHAALAGGQVDVAERWADHVLRVYGRHAGARLVRALHAERRGNVSAALDDLNFVLGADPADASARVARARLLRARGDAARARESAREALELVPGDAAVLESALEILAVDADALAATPAALARIYLRSGWAALAERHARRALSDGGVRVEVRLCLAEALWRLGRLAECEGQCKLVFDQAKDSVLAAAMLAHILSERGHTDEGQDLLQRAGEIDPEFAEARRLLGALEFHRLVIPELTDLAPPEGLEVIERYRRPPLPHFDAVDLSAAPAGPEARSPAPDTEGVDAPAPAPGAAVEATLIEAATAREAASAALGPAADGETAPSAVPWSAPTLAPDVAGARLVSLDGGVETPAPISEVAASPTPAARAPSTRAAQVRAVLPTGSPDLLRSALHAMLADPDADRGEVESVLVEATAIPGVRGLAWKLLGDVRMRAGRPQAAATAYLRAAEFSRDGSHA